MRALLVVLVVLAIAGVGADRVAHRVAMDEAEKQLAAEGFTDPQVDVGGFPFLTQLLSRDFGSVDVESAAVERDGVRARDLTATGTDVSAPSGGPVTVGRLTGEATVTYAEVLRRVGLPGLDLQPASGSRVQLTRDVTVLGRTLAVTAVGRVRADGRRLRVVPTGIELADGSSVSADLEAALEDELSVSYALRDLPDGVSVQRISPGRDGFLVRVTGSDVDLSEVGR